MNVLPRLEKPIKTEYDLMLRIRQLQVFPVTRGSGFIYFVRSSNGLTKIGYTKSIAQRFSALKSQYFTEQLELVRYIQTDCALLMESYFHRQFEDVRVHGEWFRIAPEDSRLAKVLRCRTIFAVKQADREIQRLRIRFGYFSRVDFTRLMRAWALGKQAIAIKPAKPAARARRK